MAHLELPAFFEETDDLAWDWSPHGVMVSCGEGILFCAADPATAASWAPIPALADCNATSINYAGGEFFVFEEDVCRTTIVDAVTLAVASVIQPPAAVDLPTEGRVAVVGDELFLLLKSKWMYLFGDDVDFSKAFHVNHRGVNPVWQELTGIGDRALFVDSFHGFAVPTAGFGNLESNTIYSVSIKAVNNNRRPTTVNYSVSAFNLETRITKNLASLLNGREMSTRGEKPSWIIPSLDEV